MKEPLRIPFYANLKDDNHCLQACFKMILKYYFPEKNYSFKKLDKLSKHINGKWTWQGAFLLALSKMDFEIVNIENLDYKKFAKEGDKYLKTIWHKNVFDKQNQFSDLKQEKRIAKKIIEEEKIKVINREASIKDIERYFSNNFLVAVSINPCVLVKKKCYWSHLVLITDINEKTVTFHNPGLPPIENKKVNKRLFEKAMTKPWKEDTNLIAVRKKLSH